MLSPSLTNDELQPSQHCHLYCGAMLAGDILVDWRRRGRSEVSRGIRSNLEKRENVLSAEADIVVSLQLSVAECTQHLCQVFPSPHHTGVLFPLTGQMSSVRNKC